MTVCAARSDALSLTAAAILAALPAIGCAGFFRRAPRPDEPGRVVGFVRATGDVPEGQVFPPEPDMIPVCGHEVHHDETWRVGPDRGLANCVVVLRSVGGSTGSPNPLAPLAPTTDAVFSKRGCGYVPRVLAVTEGASITLRNIDSPCRGFVARAVRNPGFNTVLPAGAETVVRLPRKEAVRVTCDVRPRMVGWIVVVDTPWFAVTGEDGGFALPAMPPGSYAVGVWHEAGGWRAFTGGAPVLHVRPGASTHAEYGMPAQ